MSAEAISNFFSFPTRTRPSHLRKGTVVPKVALVGEAVPDVSQLVLLDVLLDRVEDFFFADLAYGQP